MGYLAGSPQPDVTRWDFTQMGQGDIVRNHNLVALRVVSSEWSLNDKIVLGAPIILLEDVKDSDRLVYATPEGLVTAGYRVIFRMDGSDA